MIRTTPITEQTAERLIHTTQNESISRSVWADFAIIGAAGFSWCGDLCDGISRKSMFAGSALQNFMYRLSSPFGLANDDLKAAKRLFGQSEWKHAIRQSLQPRTIHRSREDRPLAILSI